MARRKIEDEPDARLARLGFSEIFPDLKERGRADVLEMERQPARLDAREIEDVVDEAEQLARRPVDGAKVTDLLAR